MVTQVLSYFHRSVYTICFVAAAFWPLVYGRDFISRNKILIATWSLACLSMSGFTLLPVIKIENISVMWVLCFPESANSLCLSR